MSSYSPPSTSNAPVYNDLYNEVGGGISTFSRALLTGANQIGMISGMNFLTYFTAGQDITVGNLNIANGTAAAATPTLCRAGIYSIDAATRAGTLIASSANNTALFSVANAFNNVPLTAPVALTRGQRYAVGICVVTAATPPALSGHAMIGGVTTALPRLSGYLSGQADLAANYADASLSASSGRAWTGLTP